MMITALNDIALANLDAQITAWVHPRMPMESLEWSLMVTGLEGRTSYVLNQKNRFSPVVLKACSDTSPVVPVSSPHRKSNYVFHAQNDPNESVSHVDAPRRAAQADAEQEDREAAKPRNRSKKAAAKRGATA